MKYDYLFTKNKLLSKTIDEWKPVYLQLYDIEDMDLKTRRFLSLKIDKYCKKDLKTIEKAFKFIQKKRKKWAKRGEINQEDEFFEFLYNLGLYSPKYPPTEEEQPEEETSDEPSDTSEKDEKEAKTDEEGKPEDAETEPSAEENAPKEADSDR